MTSEQQLAGWLLVLIIVTISFMVGIRFRDWLHKCTRRPDLLAPDEVVSGSKPEYKAERFSLRRLK